jgi:hypothetical protein
MELTVMLDILAATVLQQGQYCPKGQTWHDALGECRAIDQTFRMPKVTTHATQEEVDYWRLINGGTKSGQNPDMGDREGVPPSVGSGTRVRGSGRLQAKPIILTKKMV